MTPQVKKAPTQIKSHQWLLDFAGRPSGNLPASTPILQDYSEPSPYQSIYANAFEFAKITTVDNGAPDPAVHK